MSSTPRPFTLTIDGKAVAGEQTFPVVNPATGEAFEEAPDCTRDQLDAAMASAQAAFRSWRRDEARRREALLGGLEDVAPACPCTRS